MGECPEGYKRCTKCGACKPGTAEYYTTRRESKDGIHQWCRNCKAEYLREYRNQRPVPESMPLTKLCSWCHNELPISAFVRNKGTRDGLRSFCRTCENERKKANYPYERDNILLRNRQIYHSGGRERWQETRTAWRRDNAEKLREMHHQRHIKTYTKDVGILKSHNRRARKRGLADTFTPSEWQRALDYFGGCCAVCGRQPNENLVLAADHWIPLASPECPGTVATNLVPLCHIKKRSPGEVSCNRSKHTKHPTIWLTEQYGEEKAQEILDRIEAYFEWVKEQS